MHDVAMYIGGLAPTAVMVYAIVGAIVYPAGHPRQVGKEHEGQYGKRYHI